MEESPAEVEPETGAAPDADVAPTEPLGFWGGPRWFVSGRVDLGYLFLRPQFFFGWGTPHDTFVSFEADPVIAGEGVGIYWGLRGAIEHANLRVGARYFYAFTRSFLVPPDPMVGGYDHIQLRDGSGPSSTYLSLEAQLSFEIPMGPLAIVSEVTGTYVTLVPADYWVFEETLRVVVAPPFIWGASLGLEIRFGDDGQFWIMPGAEVIHLVERSDFVLRVGLRAGLQLWPDLSLRLIAMSAIVSPDSVGAAGGDTFLLGLRYVWATDRPETPVGVTVGPGEPATP